MELDDYGSGCVRRYLIKRGHNPDINKLLLDYYSVDGSNIEEGINFTVDGIGHIFMKKKGLSFFVDIEPMSSGGDYEIIHKWNTFLYELTGKTGKERKKTFGSPSK